MMPSKDHMFAPSVPVRRSTAWWVCTLLFLCATASAQEAQEITGDAILKHPVGQLLVRAADLYRAGKVDEAMALQPKEGQAEWKTMSAAARKEDAARRQKRTPSAGFADAIRKTGVLKIQGSMANLSVNLGAEGEGFAGAQLEGGQWRLTMGPLVMAPPPKNETRVEGAELAKHPIAALAIQYVDLIHAGKIDEAMRLASSEAQARWKSEPASERAESTAYRRKNLPTSAQLKAALSKNSVLFIADGQSATLNVITIEQRTKGPGSVESTSTTTTIGFLMENGQWRLAQ